MEFKLLEIKCDFRRKLRAGEFESAPLSSPKHFEWSMVMISASLFVIGPICL